MAIDDVGNIYLTDLTYAGIWKITLDGRVTLWSEHPLLHWSTTPYSGFPLGVNVLALDAGQRNIYAATSGDPLVLRIPIQPDGSAGEPIVVSRGHSLLDGIALDEEGNIYVSEIFRNEIIGLSPDGSRRVVVANKQSAPLDGNASLVVHAGTLYVANLGFAHSRWQDADRTVVAIQDFRGRLKRRESRPHSRRVAPEKSKEKGTGKILPLFDWPVRRLSLCRGAAGGLGLRRCSCRPQR